MSIELWKIITFSNFGLILDICGAILLYNYGLPENINRKGNSFLLLENTDIEEIKKAKRYDKWSRFGFLLLLCGFLFQLIGNLK